MFKKSIVIVMLISFSLVLASCNTNKNSSTNNSNIVSNENMKVTESPTLEPSTTKNEGNDNQKIYRASNNKTYDITKERYIEKEKDVIINYPQINNLKDSFKQEEINTILKDEALKSLKESKNGDVELIVLEIDYVVKLISESLLSIQYKGYANFKNAAHPYNLFFVTNVDIKKGKVIDLLELINIDNGFIELFRADKFKSVSPIYQNGYLDSLSNNELIETFKIGEFYLATDLLGISVSVPYAMGDHVEFEIKYQDIKDNIKTKNELWKDLS